MFIYVSLKVGYCKKTIAKPSHFNSMFEELIFLKEMLIDLGETLNGLDVDAPGATRSRSNWLKF